MIVLRQLSLYRGGKPVFHQASASLNLGTRIGVVGRNGAGKSTLFALLQQALVPDEGTLLLPPRCRIAHIEQHIPRGTLPALNYAMAGDTELTELQARLDQSELDDHARAEVLAQLDAIDAYSMPARGAQVLAGLGFSAEQITSPIDALSGGWRMRLNLARVLLSRADLLLLDEPTNHLDLEGIDWLERWIVAYRGSLLLISHDRELLDNCVQQVLHVEDGQLQLFAGGYSQFERERANRHARQAIEYERQQKEIARLQSFIDRFRAKATKARQAQSRVKALDRLVPVAAVRLEGARSVEFRAPASLPGSLLRLEAASAGYGERTVIANVHLHITPDTRLGLLGLNGAGKSTLIKLMAGEITARAGERLTAERLQIGYFAQHEVDRLRPSDAPLQHLRRIDPNTAEQELRDFLGRYGFPGDMATDPVAPLSGGEKARLALALLIWQRPNLLLLDEPTNHLDLAMRDALSIALQSFPGGVVIVSHDRFLLRSICNEFCLVDAQRAQAFHGDLSDYRNFIAAPKPTGVEAPRTKRVSDAQLLRNRLDNRRKPVRQRIARLEQELNQLTARRAEVDSELALPALYETPPRLTQVLAERARLDERIGTLEADWLEASSELEAIDASLAGD
jgi:ATP-binding cassette subfamily F protein 3